MADKNPFANVGLGMFGAEEAGGGLGAMALGYGIEKSGLKDFLNSKGISQNDKGKWNYAAPAVPPSLSGGLNYQNGSDIGGGVVPPQASAPVAPVAPTIQNAVVPNAPAAAPAPITTIPTPSGLGNKVLDNEYHGFDNTDQQNQNQFAQQAASQYVPGMGQDSGGDSDFLKQLAMKMMLG